MLERPRLGRHASHVQQLRARPGRGALLPGRDVPPHAGRDAVRPAGPHAPTRASSATSRESQKFEVYVTYGFANPHGHVFDRWGQDIVVDGTGAVPYHGTLFSGHLDYPQQARPPAHRSTSSARGPAPASRSSPAGTSPTSCRGTCSSPNVIGFQGILQYKIDDKGASLAGTEVEPIVSSTRPELPARRTSKIGPDGAIYFLDWQNPIIGHMQHNLRDPSRDRTHGRVYRVTYEGRPLCRSPPRSPASRSRSCSTCSRSPRTASATGPRSSSARGTPTQVIAAVEKWVAGLDKADPDYEHQMTEALWVHQYQNVVNVDLLERVLASPDFRARAAATRVLCYWRDRVPEALDTAQEAGRRPVSAGPARSGPGRQLLHRSPRRSRSPLISAEHPTDEYLDYTRGETMKALEPYWRKAVAEGKPIAVHQRRRRPVLPRNG